MLLSRMSKHFKEQNWFAICLDLIVVIIGVYLAVYIGQAENKRNDKQQAYQSLRYLYEDLQQDIAQIDIILQRRNLMTSTLSMLIDELTQPQIDRDELKRVNQLLDQLDTPTFFPNRSSYILMLENGQLINIENNKLVRKITKLYEYGYARNQTFSELSDINHDSILRNTRHHYLDRTTETLISTREDDLARLRSGLYAQRAYGESYSNFIRNDILPLMNDAKQSIEQSLSNLN